MRCKRGEEEDEWCVEGVFEHGNSRAHKVKRGSSPIHISLYNSGNANILGGLEVPSVLRNTFDGGFLVERVAGIEQTR